MTNCIEGTTAVYQPSAAQPWNKKRVQHLYNRIGIGASMADIEWALSLSPEEVVDILIDEAMNDSIPTAAGLDVVANPVDGQGNAGDNQRQRYSFLLNFIEHQSLRYKMVLFWSNHFVTENHIIESHSSWIYYYLTNLHTYAFGDFIEMTKMIGLTPAMLLYLNGNRNYKFAPNENYARELLELFTMGPGNYEQEDIEEISRLLTGWRAEFTIYPMVGNPPMPATIPSPYFPFAFQEHLFSPDKHDWNSKTIFGKTYTPEEQTKAEAFQEYIWLHHELIFKEKKDEVANFICSKLYRFFIYDEIDEDFVNELANTFKSNDWQIEPVLRQMLKSEHFFNDKAIGGNIKSPLEFLCGFLRQAGLEYDVDYFNTGSFFQYQFHQILEDCKAVGQEFLKPVNVAGWPGGKSWITENTMVKRWSQIEKKLNWFKTNLPDTQEKFRQLAKDLTADFSSADDFNNPEIITEAIARHFIIADLSPQTLAEATVAFKDNIPENYFEDGTWTLDWPEAPQQFLSLIIFLTKLPEYQLN